MKSICIKNNNNEILTFLNDKLLNLGLDSLYITNSEFKIYKNIIIHYTAQNLDFFYDKISSILTDAIIKFYERKMLNRILEYNYFYFNSLEKKEIINIALSFIESDSITKEDNFFSIYYSVMDYIKSNKSLVLEGFVNFRLQNYIKNLDYIIDIAVNKYITDKEYNEFVNMLKLYVSITPPNEPIVHLVYLSGESILLDKNKNVIPINKDDEVFNAKYLSDITFSSNDYALNALLNLVPKRLIIHLNDNKPDEFINTLKLIFEKRFEICTGCEMCLLHKMSFK